MEKTLVKKKFLISLDMKKSTANRAFEVVDTDNGNEIIINLFDDGQAVDLTECEVLAVFSNSRGTYAQDSLGNGVTIDGNVVTIQLYPTSFAPGMVECELQIFSNDMKTQVTSACFNFNCRNSIASRTSQSSRQMESVIQQLLERINSFLLGHAYSHRKGGYDEISPEDIGAFSFENLDSSKINFLKDNGIYVFDDGKIIVSVAYKSKHIEILFSGGDLFSRQHDSVSWSEWRSLSEDEHCYCDFEIPLDGWNDLEPKQNMIRIDTSKFPIDSESVVEFIPQWTESTIDGKNLIEIRREERNSWNSVSSIKISGNYMWLECDGPLPTRKVKFRAIILNHRKKVV